jgi:altronate hydrolase
MVTSLDISYGKNFLISLFVIIISHGGSGMNANVIIINEKDNVAVALADIRQGSQAILADGTFIEAVSDIPFSHKIALTDIAKGADIIKYGELIGGAKTDIKKGEWVHTHNLDIEEKGK